MENKWNIYCDETRVENLDSKYMVIGALIVPRQEKDKIVEQIKKLKKQFGFHQEIKWNKVGSKYDKLYKSLLLKFIENNSLTFRAIIVDKSKVKLDTYHNGDEELAFFKFYYLLLRELLDNNNLYYIFLDKKPTRDKNRARALKAFLDSHLLYNREQSQVKHLQAYDSSENVLIQLSDFLTGLVGYANSENNPKGYKKILSQFFQKSLIVDLTKTTSRNSIKINLLKWKSKK
ncbi:DUF3800 domain-containing protein [Patescibacteria group bacterium]|nr:DUF3800 domain-containing protein [Patescibacteria group bacterium]